MEMREINMRVFEKTREVPKTALSVITSGRLQGFYNIDPMWRIEKMTELFGPAGKGWWTETEIVENVSGMCTVKMRVYYREDNGETSHPVEGYGSCAKKTQDGADDDAFAKAETDAFGKALKKLGVGADVYYGRYDGKYTAAPVASAEPEKKPESEPVTMTGKVMEPVTEERAEKPKTRKRQAKEPVTAEIAPDPEPTIEPDPVSEFEPDFEPDFESDFEEPEAPAYSEAVRKARAIQCPIARYKGKTLGEIMDETGEDKVVAVFSYIARNLDAKSPCARAARYILEQVYGKTI